MSKKKVVVTGEEAKRMLDEWLNQSYIDDIHRKEQERAINQETGEKRKVVFHRAGGRGGYYDYE